MGIDRKGARYCDECGRMMAKAHRVHQGHEYCGSCYKRCFRSVPCITCERSARVHKNSIEPARCGICLRGERRCVRCEKLTPVAGITVGQGVACPACAPHFREPKECPICERDTVRRARRADGTVICEGCLAEGTHATCTHCQRYRRIAGEASPGKHFCEACGPAGGAVHLCPGCSNEVSGNGEGRCRSCLNEGALAHEIELQAQLLGREWARVALQGFGTWLLARSPHSPKALKVLRSHVPFFQRVDAAFSELHRMTARSLLDLFTVSGLRAHLLPETFFREVYRIDVSRDQKSEHVERERIREKLKEVKTQPWATNIEGFVEWLTGRGLPVRTQRLYLSSAVDLCTQAGIDSVSALCDAHLKKVLRVRPGLRANLSVFLTYLRSTGQALIHIPPIASAGAQSPLPKPALRLNALLGQISRHPEGGALESLEEMISIAFLIRRDELRTNEWAVEKAHHLFLRKGKQRIKVPAPYIAAVGRWSFLRQREGRGPESIRS